jgi:hypothetical protein
MTNKQRTAIHEAGHCVAAVQLGVPVIGATIDPRRPHFTRDGFRRSRNLALEHLCLICLSGPAAEELFCGPIADAGDKLDLAQARAFIADGYNEFMRPYELARLRNAAENLVRSHWARERIKRLAAALIDQGSLAAEAIYALTASRIRPATLKEYGNAYVIGGQG